MMKLRLVSWEISLDNLKTEFVYCFTVIVDSHSNSALCNVYPVALDRTRRQTLLISLWLWLKNKIHAPSLNVFRGCKFYEKKIFYFFLISTWYRCVSNYCLFLIDRFCDNCPETDQKLDISSLWLQNFTFTAYFQAF